MGLKTSKRYPMSGFLTTYSHFHSFWWSIRCPKTPSKHIKNDQKRHFSSSGRTPDITWVGPVIRSLRSLTFNARGPALREGRLRRSQLLFFSLSQITQKHFLTIQMGLKTSKSEPMSGFLATCSHFHSFWWSIWCPKTSRKHIKNTLKMTKNDIFFHHLKTTQNHFLTI